MSRDRNPNVTLGETARMRERSLDRSLPDHLVAVRDRLVEAFGNVAEGDPDGLEVLADRRELTVVTSPERLVELLTFCRDDPELQCELLSDLSGVHWPGGTREASAQATTGWPTYTETQAGRIEVDYLLTSISQGHRFRVRVNLDDEAPRLPTATGVWRAADFMEREVYDFFGVVFAEHPNLQRILMPEDWEGHPHRKDYPLGGVEVEYKGATIPPPDEREY